MKSRFFNSLSKFRVRKSRSRRRDTTSRQRLFEALEDRRLLTTVPISQIDPSAFVPNELILKFAPDTPLNIKGSIVAGQGGQILQVWENLDMVLARTSGDMDTTANTWESNPKVLYAEPNYRGHWDAFPGVFPNDPFFPQQWGLHNGGQLPGAGQPVAVADADIDAPEAWGISVGTDNVVVAIFDSGTNYNHPDLREAMWVNPGEIDGDGTDNDGNGHIDDIHGLDTFNLTSDPMDDLGHGTHVSGTAAAKGDNGIGVTGVSWNAKIMALKVGDPVGPTSAGVLAAIDYTITMKEEFGVNIVASNHSYGLGAIFSQAEFDAFEAHINAGIVPVISAGNSAIDNDLFDVYPTNYDLDGIISVAATDKDDTLAGFSQYGFNSVDLAAPGVDILSTALVTGGAITDPTGYTVLQGTSMASPHVTGALAVVRGLDPTLSVLDAKDVIIGGVDKLPSLARTVISEGRLNLHNSLNLLTAGQVRGKIWNDRDSDGKIDMSETGLEGWTVFLDLDSDRRLDSGETSVLTAADGTYRLPNYNGPGTYTVSVKKRLLYDQTFPINGIPSRSVTFEERDQVISKIDFGFVAEPGSVSGIKWNDEDGDGTRDIDEPGMGGWIIFADTDRDGRLDVGEPSVMTDSLGRYRLDNVPAGPVHIREVLKPGWVQTSPGAPNPFHDVDILPLDEITGLDFGNNASLANDFGDAPAPYPTLSANNGASHGILEGVHLGLPVEDGGSGVDAEPDGYQDATADPPLSDDTDGVDDEDGVVFLTPMIPGEDATIEVTVSLGGNSAAFLQGWIDFASDGSWSQTGDQVITNERLSEGTHQITFRVPAGATPGATYARFRYGYEKNLGFGGPSLVGEIEDYLAQIQSDDPIANNDSYTVLQDSSNNVFNVLSNDVPGKGGAARLRLTGVNASGASGTASINNNNTPNIYTDDFVIYTPAPGAFAPDAFTYTITDLDTQVTDTATVSVTITPFSGNVPVAIDDSYEVSSARNLDVLTNDRRGPTGAIIIPSDGLDLSSTIGSATVITVNVDGVPTQMVLYVPASGFSGSDQFRYTIEDADGLRSTATATIHIPIHTTNDVVRFRLETTDLSGNPITEIGQGLQFQIRAYVDDLRGDPGHPPLESGLTEADQGVYSAYMDLLYDDSLVSYAGSNSTTYGPSYPEGHDALDARVPGVLNEIGAFRGISSVPLGSGEQLLYVATYTAAAKGTASFRSDPADVLPLHETALHYPAEPAVEYPRIEFDSVEIDIVDSPDLAQIRLQVVGLNGQPLPNNQIAAGNDFLLRALVDDISAPNAGVFSAYLDVFYNTNLAVPVPDLSNPFGFNITFNPLFSSARKADISAPGIINEVGAFQGSSAVPFPGEEILFTVRMRALTPPGGGIGSLIFDADPADNQPANEVTLIKPDPGISVPTAQVSYIDAPAVTVLAAEGEGEYTNPDNAMDVNGDGYVSPFDALLLTNFLNFNGTQNLAPTGQDGGEGEPIGGFFYDVNADLVVSPLDAIELVKYLNRQAELTIGNGEGEALDDYDEVSFISAPAEPISDSQPSFNLSVTEPGLTTLQPVDDSPTAAYGISSQVNSSDDDDHYRMAVLDSSAPLDDILTDEFASSVQDGWTDPAGDTEDLLADLALL